MSRIKDPSVIEHSVEKTRMWLNELGEALGSEDRQYSYRVLRAVLHALRDRLTVDAAAKLAAQLPTLIRGIYYEDWVPSRTPLKHDLDGFLEQIAGEAAMAGETEASLGVTAVAGLLRAHVSAGEIDNVLALLPDRLGTLIKT